MSSSQVATQRLVNSRQLIVAVMVLIFTAVLTWALYTSLTSKYPGADDFYQRWRSAYGFWQERRDVYSKEASNIVEMDMFGHPASTDPASDEYPGDFIYPFNFAVLLAPLTLVQYSVAEAIWLALTTVAVGIAFVLCADLYGWRPASWLLIVGVVWAVTFYPAARGIFLGQPGTLVVCLEIMTIWALTKHQDVLAGVALGITTYKPQLGVLLIPFLMLWALRFARWRFIISFGLTSAILLGLSFLIYPPWLGEWLKQLNDYNGYTLNGSPIYAITNAFSFLGHPVELALTVLLILLAVWTWVRLVWQRNNSMFLWTAALTLTITHLVLVRTATPHFVIFLLVIVFYFRELYRRYGPWLVLAAMAILTVGLWWLFLATLVAKFESQVNYLPLPWAALALLLLTQGLWRQRSDRVA